MNSKRLFRNTPFVAFVLAAVLLINIALVQAQGTCEGAGSINFVSWDSFGVVKLEYANTGSAPMRLTDFSIVWGNIVTRANLPAGVLTLKQVTAGGNGPADPLSTQVWDAPAGEDAASPTNGHSEGTWNTDYIFPSSATTSIYMDFEGTSSNLQSAFGAQVSDFDGTAFTLTPDCSGSGTGSGSGGSGSGGGTGSGGDTGGGTGSGGTGGSGSGGTGGSGTGGSGGVGNAIIIGISDNHGGTNINQERANIGYGDHFAVIFTHDGADNPALRIYRVGDNDEGWLAVALDMDDIPTNVEENTLLIDQNGVAVYALTSGEVQVVLGPDETGKVYTIIMNMPYSGASYQ